MADPQTDVAGLESKRSTPRSSLIDDRRAAVVVSAPISKEPRGVGEWVRRRRGLHDLSDF